MRERNFYDGWSFLKTDLKDDYNEMVEYNSQFKPISIPHDWIISDANSFYESSVGWYHNTISLQTLRKSSLQYKEGEHIYLRFDGVYMDSTLYINKVKAFEWKYGYSTFGLDITDYLTQEENEILVKVVYQTPNSRWYSGAGIYRKVTIRVMGESYLPYDGTYLHIEPKGEDFLIEAETEVHFLSTKHQDASVTYALYKGYALINEEQSADELIKISDTQYIYKKSIIAKKPDLWDIESPQLYKLKVSLYHVNGDSVLTDHDFKESSIDDEDITIGFRTLDFTQDSGLYLNGKHIKLHGVCEHHDLGCLGAAFNKEALRRKFTLLREMGVNAIRTSHNMPAREFMDLADEMGFLILSEIFDMWEIKKTDYDYARYFKDWHERDIKSWIKRDRNHPCILMWSVGNEIYDTHVSTHGIEILQDLVRCVRKYDPKKNAPITHGNNYMPWENAQKCTDLIKYAGYNYAENCYEAHHKQHPDWVIYGSETGSVVQSRGVYHFPIEQNILSDDDEQCSSLGNSLTSWGAKSIEHCIADDRDCQFSLGEFVWTGFDYIGEPTPYHTKNSYFGQLDTAGFKKDSYFIYQSEWVKPDKKPMIHIFPYWDFSVSQMINVQICSNLNLVELFVNGRSYGRMELNHIKGTDFVASYEVPYIPGEIKAVAYDAFLNIVAEESRHSFQDAVKIIVKADKNNLHADGEDLCFVEISTVDEYGNPVENAMNYLKVTVDGNAFLAGLDNGDSTDYDSYKSPVRKLFNGKLLAIVQAKKTAGDCHIVVTGEGLKKAEIKLPVIDINWTSQYEFQRDEVIPVSYIKDEDNDIKYNSKPVRKIYLKSTEGCTLTRSVSETIVEADIYPTDASDQTIYFEAVNDAGIPIEFVKIAPIDASTRRVCVKALGNGTFRIRAMSKSGTEKVKIISSMEFLAVGLGAAYLNPYHFIYGGLYTESIGDIQSGNEKGFATERDATSGVIFTDMDFGNEGSDMITIPIFALSDAPVSFQIWLGEPSKKSNNRLLFDGIYQKPSIWNTYQEETFKLNRKVRGINDLSFIFHDKVHIKGFQFLKMEEK